MDVETMALEKWNIVLKRVGKEWHSACPACGGKDRLITWPEGNAFCRQCEQTFWLTDLKTLDPLEQIERQRKARELAERERMLQLARLKTFQEKTAYRKGWHDAMNFAAREWWHTQGITDESIDRYGLGATTYPLVNQRTGERVNLTAFTIPIHDPDTWAIVNMQYRLENPPPGVGKYRQEAGLPARSFYARPHTGGDVLIVEGAKKAMVLEQTLEGSIQIVGLPGISPGERLIDELKCYRRKWLIPDPGVSDAQLKRFRERLPHLEVVWMPFKPDDAVIQYGISRADFREWIMQTRRHA